MAAVAAVLFVVVTQQFGVRSANAVSPIENDALPVASLTPGATWNVTVDEVCAPAGHEHEREH